VAVTEAPPVAVGVGTTDLDSTLQSSLEIPNWVEYWYWPLTSSISWRP
jgi:hypothetical protein